MADSAGRDDDGMNSDSSQPSQNIEKEEGILDEESSSSESGTGTDTDKDDLEENNNPRPMLPKQMESRCKHVKDINPSDLSQLLQKKLKCMTCHDSVSFSCAHQDCINSLKSSCCKNSDHLLPHMAVHNHPPILYHDRKSILCTRCMVYTPVKRFLTHTKFSTSDKVEQETRKMEPLAFRGLLGYLNFGNTCYMNAVLQLLGHCSPFTQYLIELIPPGGWSNCSHDIPKTAIQMALDLRNMYSDFPLPYLSPWKIITCVRNEMPGFECFQQQDASEFMRNLLDILDRDLKTCSEYHRTNTLIEMGNPEMDYAIAMNAPHTKTAISAIFQGVLENQIQCHSCGFRSRTIENFLDLSIPIVGENEFEEMYASKKLDTPKAPCTSSNIEDGQDPGFLVHQGAFNKTSLESCLDRFFQNSTLQDDNQYSCSKCEVLVDATKSTKAHRLPEVIIIQLKRFRHTMFGSCKVGKVVEFPLRSQDFGRWTTSGEPALYDLVGFVVHEGRSLEFGHYVSYCRHEQDNQWYKFDDMVVTRCDATQVAKSQPYILMYRKHTTNGEPSISQNTESPFNFFASRRLFSDRDSEAWDVIRKCLDEDGKEKKVAGSSRKNIRKKKKRMTKQQITDILKKASIDDVEQHYKALQQIMDDIVKSLSQKDPNRDKNKASQDASKEALNNLVISMETWFKVMIKKKWVERRLEEERELDETHRLLYQDESIPNTSG